MSEPATDETGRLVALDEIDLSFGRKQVLNQASLTVDRGEIVTLIGLNGSGKTSLVRVLLGLIKPDRGRVWRRPGLRIGYVPQALEIDHTLPLTVERFLGLAGADRARCRQALARVGVPALGKQPMQGLSGGEKRRVLLAQALVGVPDLLVLDEPTAGVDVAGQADLYELIDQLRDETGAGVLLVSHDLYLVMAATDRVVCLNHHVCCSGKPTAVIDHPAFVALFGRRLAETVKPYRHDHGHRHSLSGEAHDPHDH